MWLGDVVGRLWAAQTAVGLPGQTLLLVRPLGASGPTRRLIVAVDRLGAGPGERVLVAHGSRVRDLTVGAAVPDKDVVVAIVDDFHIDGANGANRADDRGAKA